MVPIVVPQEARKQNSLLPKKLYVDASQTTSDELKLNEKLSWLLSAPEKGKPYISYRNANRWAELNQTRLPSAAEYDIIVGAVEHGETQSVRTGEPARMEDLFDGYPEWSTTVCSDSRVVGNGMAAVHKMHVLKGFKYSNELVEFVRWIDGTLLADPDLQSPRISIRGVRSATPRFVKP
jgi:hypothetical protein